MEASNVLADMAEFDFNAQINVTLIFEESNEDESSIKTNTNDNDQTHAITSKTVTDTHNQPNTSIKYDQIEGQNIIHKRKSTKTTTRTTSKTRKCDEVAGSSDSNLNTHENEDGIRSFNMFSKDNNSSHNAGFYKNNHVAKSIDNANKNEKLYAVSKYLICIIVDYHKYVRLVHQSDQGKLAILKRDFLTKKYNYFNLSFETVETLFLPQKNPDFIQKFCEVTYKVAKSRLFEISIEEIYYICQELVKWTKEQRNHLNFPGIEKNLSKKPNEPPTDQNSDLLQHLHSKTTIHRKHDNINAIESYRTNRNESVNQTSYFSIFKNGLERGPISINFLPRAPKQIFQLQTQQNNMHVQDHSNLYNNYQHTNNHTRQAHQSTLNQNNQMIDNDLRKGIIRITASCNPREAPPTYSLEDQINIDSAGLVHGVRHPQQSNVNNINYISPTANKVRMPSPEVNEPVRTCVSTDSGIMSPPYLLDEMTSSNIQITPVINNVTSLSPHADVRPELLCSICGNLTKNVCLGCFSRYYCCTLCQQVDWAHVCNKEAALGSGKQSL